MTVSEDMQTYGSRLKRSPWLIAAAIAAAVALWMVSGIAAQPDERRNDNTLVEADTSAPRVQVRRLEAQPVTRYVELYGRTEPARSATLAAETGGRVVEIVAPRGSLVRAGEVLMRLDDRDRYARLEEARAAVARFEADYAAQQRLKGEGYVSDTQIAATRASLEAARAELARAELDLDRRFIRAPFDGVFEDRLVEVGDFVSVGDPVARFVEKQNLVVVGNLAEQHASRVRVGDVGRASLVTGDVVEGRIRYVAPVAEQSTRTFRVELEVPNGDLALPAGVTAELRLPVGEVMAQRVPASLLSLDDDGTLGIKLVDESGRVRFYPADIAASGNDGVWLAGLPAEADVIVVGQGFVGSGDLVRAVAADGDSALAVREAEDAP